MAKIKLIIGPTNKVGDDYEAIANVIVRQDGRGNDPLVGESVVFRCGGTQAGIDTTTPEGVAEIKLSSKTLGLTTPGDFQVTAYADGSSSNVAVWKIVGEKKATGSVMVELNIHTVTNGASNQYRMSLVAMSGGKPLAKAKIRATGTDGVNKSVNTRDHGEATINWTVAGPQDVWISFTVNGFPVETIENLFP